MNILQLKAEAMDQNLNNPDSKLRVFLFLVVTTLASHCQGWGGDGSSSNGAANSPPNCTDLRSQLTEFYSNVYWRFKKPENFLLRNLGSDNNECVRVVNASWQDGANVGLFPCNDTDPTQFLGITVTGVMGSFINLPTSGKALTIESWSSDENALVTQFQIQYYQNQQWWINYAADNIRFQVSSSLSGKCLTGYANYSTVTTCGNLAEVDSVPRNQLWKKLIIE